MPFLYWLDENRYTVSTQWLRSYENEFELEAKEIDRILDNIFDQALINLSELQLKQDDYKKHKEFYRDYAVGRSIIDSEILLHSYLAGNGTKSKPPELLVDKGNYEMIVEKGINIAFYTAIGRKASLGKSLDFYEKDRWKAIRPTRKNAVKEGEKRASGKKDIYARAVYLAEQDLNMALLTFGGIVDLVSGAFERNLMSLKLRNSIAKFCGQFNIDKREKYYSRDVRREMYKKLNKLFPSSGAGSSKSPENYTEEVLLETLNKIWSEF